MLIKTVNILRNPMLCSWGFFIVAFVFTTSLHGQKVLKKSWDAAQFDQLVLLSEQVYRIEIASEKTTQIRLEMHIDGEYADNMMVSVTEDNRILKLAENYRPLYEPPNDKLAAHKVISIEMKLYVPEDMNIHISAEIGSVIARGNYEKLEVTLVQGFCELYQFKGDGTVLTKGGDITVYAQEGMAGEAYSKYGTVENELVHEGSLFLRAESVNGHIRLLKTTD